MALKDCGLRGQKQFDVVLSDISMPGMDGFEFLSKLRRLPGYEDVPAVALTGFGRPEDVQRAQRQGFYAHLTKPFDIQTLGPSITKNATPARSTPIFDVKSRGMKTKLVPLSLLLFCFSVFFRPTIRTPTIYSR